MSANAAQVRISRGGHRWTVCPGCCCVVIVDPRATGSVDCPHCATGFTITYASPQRRRAR